MNWKRLFSLSDNGASLVTLYHNARHDERTLLVIRTDDSDVFGVYASQCWRPRGEEYFGTGECSLFSVRRRNTADSPALPSDAPVGHIEERDVDRPPEIAVSGIVERHRWTYANNLFMLATPARIAVGGGGNFAIMLDDELLQGSSGACETFGTSRSLGSSEMFRVREVELWGFWV